LFFVFSFYFLLLFYFFLFALCDKAKKSAHLAGPTTTETTSSLGTALSSSSDVHYWLAACVV